MQKQESSELRYAGIDTAAHYSSRERRRGGCSLSSQLRSSPQEQRPQLRLRHRPVPDWRPDFRLDAAGLLLCFRRHRRRHERKGALGLPATAELPGRTARETRHALARQRHRPWRYLSLAIRLFPAARRIRWCARVAVVVNFVGGAEPGSSLEGTEARTSPAGKKRSEIVVERLAAPLSRWFFDYLDYVDSVLPTLCEVSFSGIASGTEQRIHPHSAIERQMRAERGE